MDEGDPSGVGEGVGFGVGGVGDVVGHRDEVTWVDEQGRDSETGGKGWGGGGRRDARTKDEFDVSDLVFLKHLLDVLLLVGS